jgi:hypothetical protein
MQAGRSRRWGEKPAVSYRRQASKIEQPTNLRLCPLCADENKNGLGEPYWHRSQQIAGVTTCYRHGILLLENREKVDFNDSWVGIGEFSVESGCRAMRTMNVRVFIWADSRDTHGLTVVFGPTTTFCVISKNLSGPILNGANLIITVDNIKVAQFILPAS